MGSRPRRLTQSGVLSVVWESPGPIVLFLMAVQKRRDPGIRAPAIKPMGCGVDTAPGWAVAGRGMSVCIGMPLVQ